MRITSKLGACKRHRWLDGGSKQERKASDGCRGIASTDHFEPTGGSSTPDIAPTQVIELLLLIYVPTKIESESDIM
jgi:hypothetical protein